MAYIIGELPMKVFWLYTLQKDDGQHYYFHGGILFLIWSTYTLPDMKEANQMEKSGPNYTFNIQM